MKLLCDMSFRKCLTSGGDQFIKVGYSDKLIFYSFKNSAFYGSVQLIVVSNFEILLYMELQQTRIIFFNNEMLCCLREIYTV